MANSRVYPGQTAALAYNNIEIALDIINDSAAEIPPTEHARLRLAAAQALLAHATYARITEIKTAVNDTTLTQIISSGLDNITSAIDNIDCSSS